MTTGEGAGFTLRTQTYGTYFRRLLQLQNAIRVSSIALKHSKKSKFEENTRYIHGIVTLSSAPLQLFSIALRFARRAIVSAGYFEPRGVFKNADAPKSTNVFPLVHTDQGL